MVRDVGIQFWHATASELQLQGFYIKVECYLKNKTKQFPLHHLFLSFKSKPNPFWAGAIRKTAPYRTEIAA